MLRRCPRLRKLCVIHWNSDSVVITLPVLEELAVRAIVQIQHINIVAPALKKLYLHAPFGIHKEFSLSFSAPAVEDLTWKCESRAKSYQFGVTWHMWNMTFSLCLQPHGHTQLTNNNSQSMHMQPQHSLNLERKVFSGDAAKTFEQEIRRFQVTDFSILELNLSQGGHVYGAVVLHLLGLCTSIQRLKVTLDYNENTCNGDCHCDQPNNWRSQNIPLTDLKEVEIQQFIGEDHEVDLLKVLLRCATVLEKVTLRFSREFASRDHHARMEIDGILKTYPSVKCNIYQ